ncbi:trypsin-like peptidase domain-containing protein [Candidatus Saccharibacteria bacterium]|nr:trypsin-like peptidase domain-containing protein [Candidatus Saccharibacteria bacterium]
MSIYANGNRICQYSLSSILIEIKTTNKCRPDELLTLATGTGFLFRHNGAIFLISNWHNFSGLEFDGEYKTQCKDLNGALPELFTLHGPNPNVSHDIKIINNGKVLWQKHPQKQVDIAAIRFTEEDVRQISKLGLFPINEFPTQEDMFIEIASDVFIVGYPYGRKANTDNSTLPIFKRGSIASEPELSYYKDRQSFLVDSNTRKGMSGSPVLQISQNGYTTKNGSICMDCNTHYKLLGIYSGRIKECNGVESSIGIVWDKSLIMELLESAKQ